MGRHIKLTKKVKTLARPDLKKVQELVAADAERADLPNSYTIPNTGPRYLPATCDAVDADADHPHTGHPDSRDPDTCGLPLRAR